MPPDVPNPNDKLLAAAQKPQGDTDALFAQLGEFRWKDIGFPSTSFEVELRHDLVIHAYPDRDGADVEGTGRAPLQFTAHIPFLNGVSPAKNETWGDVKQVTLYPYVYRKFITACADKKTGILNHPEFGEVPCKLSTCHSTWTGTTRDGCIVTAVWIETSIKGDTQAGSDFLNPSPISQATSTAFDLDAQVSQSITIPASPVYAPSFADSMRSIQAVGDQISIMSKSAAGKIDTIAYRVNALSDSATAARDSLNWPVVQSIEKMKSALIDLKKALLVANRPIGFYYVTQESTFAAICAAIPADLGECMKLNVPLLFAATVPARSQVRYYVDKDIAGRKVGFLP